jgi:RNA polymerase sigma factor (sigma-70 family)
MKWIATPLVEDGVLSRTSLRLFDYPKLSEKDEKELIRRYKEKNDLRAREKLILSHLRLVFKVVLEEFSRDYYTLIPDLIQEGSIGLLDALYRFDLTKNTRFSTFAMYCIRSRIQAYLRLSKPSLLLSKLIPRSLVEEGDPLERYEYREDIEMYVIKKVLEQKLMEFRDKLDARERMILDERILSNTSYSLQEIGDIVGVTRERIRQIEKRLLEKLKRYLSENLCFEDFLE